MAGRKDYEQRFILNAQLNGGFNAAFSKAQQEFSRLGNEIRVLDRLQKDVSGYQKQQSAVQNTEKKLQNLTRQQLLLKEQMKSASADALPGLEREYLVLEQKIGDTTAALERQNQRLSATGERLRGAGVNMADLSGESQSLASRIEALKDQQSEAAKGAATFGEKAAAGVRTAGAALAAAGVGVALKEIASALGDCNRAAMEYETVMAGVQRTVGGSKESVAALGAGFRELSTDIPITTSELGKIAETAGQLGIVQSAVGEFTGVMAQLGTTTDLTADSAATLLAQFANITGTTDYRRLGSVVAELGDTTATTASKVVEMAQGLAASADQAGMSERDILAISAAVGSLGIEAQAGSTAMSTLISTLYKAVETGEGLADFAAVSGMSAAAFKTAWGRDAAGALDSFIRGLNDTERNGRSAVVILDELGITNVRQTKAILGLASAGDLLSGTIAQANAAWEENTALQEKASVMYSTTQSKLAMMQNAFNNLKIAIGEKFSPMLGEVYELGTDALKGVTAWVEAIGDGVPSVRSLTGAARDMRQAAAEAARTYEETAASTLAAVGVAEVYIGKLETMGDYASLSAEGQREYHDILSLLCQTVPELAAGIDLESNAIEGGTAALRANTEGWRQNAMAQAMQDKLTAMYAAQADVLVEAEKNRLRLTEAQAKAEIAEKALYAAQDRMSELMEESQRNGTALTREYFELQESLSGLELAYQEAVKPIDAYQKAVDEGTAAASAAEAEIALAAEAVESLTGAAGDQTGVLPDLENAITPVRDQVQLLAAAYGDAYDAALESMNGQYELWDKAEKTVPTSAASVNAALESQAKYWRDYNANIQTVLDNAGDVEGLGEMLASLTPGDQDTVNFVAGLAAASKKDKQALEDMVSNWRDAKSAQEEAAGSFAEYVTDFAGQMEGLQDELVQGVQAMDLSQEAAESARATIQAFIDQARSMAPQVREAYAGLGQAALAAISAVPAAVPAPESGAARYKGRRQAYASGTSNASPGVALVGERGPELVVFQGGERVLNAAETASLAAEPLRALPVSAPASGPVSVQFAVRVEGNASAETVESIRGYVESEDFKERVRDVIAEARTDAARRVMR